jgi:signal peptidase
LVAEFDKMVQSALVRRGTLVTEIADLERRRLSLAEVAPRHVIHAVVDQPAYPERVVVPPLFTQPLFAPPTYPEPSAVQPAYPEPVVTQSFFAQPAQAEPVIAQPVYQEPVVPRPVYEEPVYAHPEFARPPIDRPAFAQPVALPPLIPERPIALVPAPVRAQYVKEVPAGEPRRSRSRVSPVRLVFSVLFGSILLGLAVLLTPVSQVIGGLQLLAVMSGSMEPTIPVGGVVGVRPVLASDLKVGDVITFANTTNPDVLVTHRVVTLQSVGGQTLLTTKGDANDAVDAVTTSANRTVGRVDFSAPWLGYLMFWLAAPLAKAGILVVSVIGFALPSLKRTPHAPEVVEASPAVHASQSFLALEREIQDLLPRAS